MVSIFLKTFEVKVMVRAKRIGTILKITNIIKIKRTLKYLFQFEMEKRSIAFMQRDRLAILQSLHVKAILRYFTIKVLTKHGGIVSVLHFAKIKLTNSNKIGQVSQVHKFI